MSELRCGTCGQSTDDEEMAELRKMHTKALDYIRKICCWHEMGCKESVFDIAGEAKNVLIEVGANDE